MWQVKGTEVKWKLLMVFVTEVFNPITNLLMLCNAFYGFYKGLYEVISPHGKSY